MTEKVIIEFFHHKREMAVDIEVPLDISAHEMVLGLSHSFQLGLVPDRIEDCYLACENPIVLLRGNRTLRELGVRHGSLVHFTR